MSIDLIDISNNYLGFNKVCHLGYYIATKWEVNDQLSKELLNFKHNKASSVRKWIRLFDNVELPSERGICVRVLGHNELKVNLDSNQLSLDILGLHLQENYENLVYIPQIISKTRQTQALKFLGRDERTQELEGTYQCYKMKKNYEEKKYNKFIYTIIDDVITTGSSLMAVAGTIRDTYPNAIINCLTLAKTSDPEPEVLRYNQQLYNFLTGKSQQISSPPTGWKDVSELFQDPDDYDDDDSDYDDDASKWSENSTESG